MGAIKKILNRYGLLLIILLWTCTVLVHLKIYGIVTNLEAEKYISEAKNLLNNKGFSALRFWFYSITIFVITFSLKFKIGFTGAVLIQAVFNLCAFVTFYKSLKLIFNSSPIIPFLIIVIAITFSPYSSWNVFLYTESIFYSSTLLLLSTVINHNYNKKNIGLATILGVLLLTILSRPLGILFIPAVLIYFYTCLGKKLKLAIIPIAIIGIGVLMYIINIVFTTTSDATITLSAQQGCVICGILPSKQIIPDLLLNGSPFQQLYYYLGHNFFNFMALALQRLKAFYVMTRTYYSFSHNAFLILYIAPIYLLTFISFTITKEHAYKPVFYFILISIVTFTIAVMLQCDDYHNRFVLTLFPFFLILAAKALAYKKKATQPFPSSPTK